MTDRQFDSYQKRLLKLLLQIREENEEKQVENKRLEDLINDISEELKRP